MSILVTAMFMAKGAVRDGMDRSNFDAYGGQIGFFDALSEYAQVVEYRCAIEADFPGVIDYEVSEPFGRWYALNRPERMPATVELNRRLDAFFAQGKTPQK